MSGGPPHDELDATRTSIGAATLLKKDRLLAGRYRVAGPLGVGGMGLVYRAHDERLKVDVALKVLRPERAPDQAMLDRFEREIVLSREVSHPNVLRIHDIGQDGELHFITMDLVEGRSLRNLLEDEGALQIHRAAAIAAEIAAGLKAAHDKGVIHRDLKPGNILLDNDGKAFVADFGVARSLHAASLTATGLIVGSPDYLAPEQALGDEIDGRTDIYALGLMLYEMLTGELPFRSGGTLHELIAQRTVGEARDLAASDVKVPAWMRRIVSKCLQRDPAQRYQDAGELAADLQAHNAPALRLPRLRRAHLVAGGLTVLAVAAVITFTWWRPAPGDTETLRIAVLPLVNETGDESIGWMATGLSDMLDTQLGSSARIDVIETARVNSTLSDLRLTGTLDARAQARLGELLGADHVITGTLRRAGDQLRIEATVAGIDDGNTTSSFVAESLYSQPTAAIAPLAIQVRKALAVRVPVSEQIVLSDSAEALQSYTLGRAALRGGDSTSAIPYLQSAVAADPQFSVAWFHLAEALDLEGRIDEAEKAIAEVVSQQGEQQTRLGLQSRALQAALAGEFERSRDLLAQLIERYPSDSEARVALAEAFGNEGRFDEAADILADIVAADENHPRAWFLLGKYAIQSGDSHRAIDEYLVRDLVVQNRLENAQGRANVLNALGIAYGRIGQLDAAREHYEQAAEIRQQIGDQRGMATSLNNLARVEMMLGNFDAARSNLEQAKQVSADMGDQAAMSAFINTIGTVEEEAGNYDQALAEYRDALKIREQLGDRRALTESYNNVGFAYYMLGELDNARIYWERALDEARELGNRDDEMQVLQSLGLLYTASAEWDEATRVFLDALTISREVEYPEAEAVSLGYLGQVAALQGRFDAALSQVEEALNILEPVNDTRGLAEFGLVRARIYAQLDLNERAEEQLEQIGGWLAETPNRAQQAEHLRLQASIASDPQAASSLLQQALDAAQESGSVAAQIQAQLTEAVLALKDNAELASRSAAKLAERTRRNGLVRERLQALETVAQAELALGNTEKAAKPLGLALDLLAKHGPYANAFRIHAMAAEVFGALGQTDEALSQQQLATTERARVRQALPRVALARFDARFDAGKKEALVDDN